MKRTIYITKQMVIAVLFLLVGGYCTLCGIISLYRANRYIPLDRLTADNCREGAYIAGTIESCVTITVDGKELGESDAYISLMGGGNYHCFTVPMADSQYIRIMLSNEDTADAMQGIIVGESKGVYVEGQITKEMTSINYPWYERNAQLKDLQNQRSVQVKDPQEEILQDYVIKQISFEKRSKTLYLGIEILVITIFIIWRGKILQLWNGMEETDTIY